MRNYADKFRRYAAFSVSEIKSLTITVILLSFIVAFDDGRKTFDAALWAGNFLMWLLIVLASVLIKQLGHRFVAIGYGFRVEYKLWWYGILIGLAISFVTLGGVWLLIPGGIVIHHMAVHRMGWFRYGINLRAFSMIALAGPVANIIFATLIKSLQTYTPLISATNQAANNIFLFNVAFAVWSMLPIPPLDGSRIIYDSRLIYFFTFGTIAGYGLFAFLGINSILLALVAGIIVWYLYYHYGEREL